MSPEMASPFSGIIVSLLMRWLVNSPKFKLVNPGEGVKIQAMAAILSAIASLLAAWASGSFNQGVLMGLMNAVIGAYQTLGVSALIHHWILKPSIPSSPVDQKGGSA